MCPHCRTFNIKGVNCKFCGIRLKFSQSVSLPYSLTYACVECIQKVIIEPQPVKIRCSICSHSTVYNCKKTIFFGKEELEWDGNNTCSNCGDKLRLPSEIKGAYTHCIHCKLLLKKSESVQISDDKYVHNLCHTLNSDLQQRQNEYTKLLVEVKKKETLENFLMRISTLEEQSFALIFYLSSLV